MNEKVGTQGRDRAQLRRAHLSFWTLVGLAVLTAGTLSGALVANPSPLTGGVFAFSAVVLVSSLALATRVMVALQRSARPAAPPELSKRSGERGRTG